MMADYLQTFTNKHFYPLNPREEDICIEDIAHALSHLCRFAGHTREFYSVGQHSVLIARSLPEEYKLWGLLHDATEAYLVDVPRPLKVHLPEYKEIENNLMRVICSKFGLDPVMPPAVKDADNEILLYELAYLMPDQPTPKYKDDFHSIIWPWTFEETYDNFLGLFDELCQTTDQRFPRAALTI